MLERALRLGKGASAGAGPFFASLARGRVSLYLSECTVLPLIRFPVDEMSFPRTIGVSSVCAKMVCCIHHRTTWQEDRCVRCSSQLLPSPSFFARRHGAFRQGHLIKLSTYASQGELRYFRLEDGLLTCYDKRPLARTRNTEV